MLHHVPNPSTAERKFQRMQAPPSVHIFQTIYDINSALLTTKPKYRRSSYLVSNRLRLLLTVNQIFFSFSQENEARTEYEATFRQMAPAVREP